jgi:UDP-2,3-diacylglucosamine hydrolase
VERRLALIAGAGDLPGRAAAEARRQGWEVVAFAVRDDCPGLEEHADEVVPASFSDIQAVTAALAGRAPQAAVFCGKLTKADTFARAAALGRNALTSRGLSDAALGEMAVAVLTGLGIEVLDPRRFLGQWLVTTPSLTRRVPSPDEWEEVQAALRVARVVSTLGVGQTVVWARGVTVAVEGAEGTDETIRRGTRLSGPGAVVVKAVAPGHDYRFDLPTVGPVTVAAAADGGAAVLAVDRGRVLVLDRDAVVRMADTAGLALVSVEGDGRGGDR